MEFPITRDVQRISQALALDDGEIGQSLQEGRETGEEKLHVLVSIHRHETDGAGLFRIKPGFGTCRRAFVKRRLGASRIVAGIFFSGRKMLVKQDAG